MLHVIAKVFRAYAYYTPIAPGRGLAGALANLLTGPFAAEVAPNVTFRIHLNQAEDLFYWRREYEYQGEITCFNSLLQPGMTVVDIGANMGLFSILAAKGVGPTGRVYCFEPMATPRARLHDHLQLNQVTNAEVISAAVSDTSGAAQFFPNESAHGTALGSLVRPISNNTLSVQTYSLDDFKAENCIRKIDVVKIDVEGAEPLVLQGMTNILRSDRPRLLVEHNQVALARQGTTPAALFDSILSYDYSGFLIQGGKMIPVTSVSPPVYTTSEPSSNYIFIPRDTV